MKQSVTIFGAGVAGVQLAKALSNKADVTLVSPLDYFEVPMAMPRLLVEPNFADKAIVPLSELSSKVTYLQGKLVAFDDIGASVETPDGQHVTIKSGVSVLATGSRYANSVTRAQSGSIAQRLQEFRHYNGKIAAAKNVLIVGGGAVGIEIAGEITQDYPDTRVTVIESGPRLLKGTSDQVAAHAQATLEARGVNIVLNDRVISPDYGDEPDTGIAKTESGQKHPFDMIFWAVGSRPNTDYMAPKYLSDRGEIRVDEHFQVEGLKGVFAMGDIAAINEPNKAMYAGGHSQTVSKNILDYLAGKPLKARYKPQTNDDTMLVTLGREGGVAHMPVIGVIKSKWVTRMFKARDMLTGMFRKSAGAPKDSPSVTQLLARQTTQTHTTGAGESHG